MIPALTNQQLKRVQAFQEYSLTIPQLPIVTRHCFHAGLYCRTLTMLPDMVICGAHIKIDTVLTVSGDCTIATGGGSMRVTGYHVMRAAAGRKQVFVAHSETHLTMQFATNAKTVEDAEREFTDEWELLASHYNENVFD